MSNKEALLTQQLQELKKCYQDELPGKLNEIEELWKKLTQAWSKETLSVLTGCLHRISGSAGSFGYHDLGGSAAQAQQVLKPYNESSEIPDSEQIKTLTSTIEQLLGHR